MAAGDTCLTSTMWPQVYVGSRGSLGIAPADQYFSLLGKDECRSCACDDQAGTSHRGERAEAGRGSGGSGGGGQGCSPRGSWHAREIVHQCLHRGVPLVRIAGQRP